MVPADPARWSAESRRSVAVEFVKNYSDISYACWHCGQQAVFTASAQQYTFESKKANINQRRILCHSCWEESLKIVEDLQACAEQWSVDKVRLKADAIFLSRWLELLTQLESYVPYKHDSAKKNMLKKLLADAQPFVPTDASSVR